jgi:NhaA family Na+:H+ antiporter
MRNRLDPPVDEASDHVLGPPNAAITLVEYGGYTCPHCRAVSRQLTVFRDHFGENIRYVFRHLPDPDSGIARRAAELVERASDPKQFWKAHLALMTRSQTLTEADLTAVADDLGLAGETPGIASERAADAKARVDAGVESARASGARITPTFFINGRRYLGLWDESSLIHAMEGSLAHRVRSAALDFVRWGPASGLLLLLATIAAVSLTNSPFGPGFVSFWEKQLGLIFGDGSFRMSLLHWVNDGLLTLFFFVVGLEIKREFTVGHLAGRKSAAMPLAAAIGGLAVPALLYRVILPQGPWAHGWGVPMSTDTAFAVALIVMMGHRVPVELRIFLTAAAIVDDIGAILVVALVYSQEVHGGYLVAAGAITGLLALLNRLAVYRISPYVLAGVGLWACVYAGGLHATLAGVILAMFIPTRQPANLEALRAQAEAILTADARYGGEALHRGPSEPAMRALDAIHERLESPADRMLRTVSLRSNYVVLPLFALANAGVALSLGVLSGHGPLIMAIGIGLVVGKPLGMVSACALAVRLGLAVKPDEYSWRQVAGAGGLAGIGFTMSLFVAGEAFPNPSDFAAAKIAVFAASLVSACIGVAVLWREGSNGLKAVGETPQSGPTDQSAE